MPNCTRHILKAFVLLIFLLPMVQSCDFFRRLAGRPDSAFIEAKRQQIEQEKHAHQARLDSVKNIRNKMADSLAILESIKQHNNAVVEARQLDPDSKAQLKYRYYIIIGSFAKSDNAKSLADMVAEKGYEPTLIRYKNGFTAVGVCPTNSLKMVPTLLDSIVNESFVPDGIWVLNNE